MFHTEISSFSVAMVTTKFGFLGSLIIISRHFWAFDESVASSKKKYQLHYILHSEIYFAEFDNQHIELVHLQVVKPNFYALLLAQATNR